MIDQLAGEVEAMIPAEVHTEWEAGYYSASRKVLRLVEEVLGDPVRAPTAPSADERP